MVDPVYRECIKTDKKYIPGSQPIVNHDTESELKTDLVKLLIMKKGLLNLLDDNKKKEYLVRMMNSNPKTALYILDKFKNNADLD